MITASGWEFFSNSMFHATGIPVKKSAKDPRALNTYMDESPMGSMASKMHQVFSAMSPLSIDPNKKSEDRSASLVDAFTATATTIFVPDHQRQFWNTYSTPEKPKKEYGGFRKFFSTVWWGAKTFLKSVSYNAGLFAVKAFKDALALENNRVHPTSDRFSRLAKEIRPGDSLPKKWWVYAKMTAFFAWRVIKFPVQNTRHAIKSLKEEPKSDIFL